jgi:hypothetical protein
MNWNPEPHLSACCMARMESTLRNGRQVKRCPGCGIESERLPCCCSLSRGPYHHLTCVRLEAPVIDADGAEHWVAVAEVDDAVMPEPIVDKPVRVSPLVTIHELRAAGMSCRMIAEELNRRGSFRLDGKPWTHQSVRARLPGPLTPAAARRQQKPRPVSALPDLAERTATAAASMYSALLDALRAA